MEDTKNVEELRPNEPESFEVAELDNRDLEGVVGGTEADAGAEIISDTPSNTNCGCHGKTFEGVAGASNGNCGC